MLESGLLIASEQSTPVHSTWPERGLNSSIGISFYDSTNPTARDYFWEQVKNNYYNKGIRSFARASEPEMKPGYPSNLRFAAGPGLEVRTSIPENTLAVSTRACFTAARRKYSCCAVQGGQDRPTLWRGNLVGRHCGDVRVIPSAGTSRTKYGHERNPMVDNRHRWVLQGRPRRPGIQGASRPLVRVWRFLPLFRIHGDRLPNAAMGTEMTGGPNEIWSFGDEACSILTSYILLRERLRPYLHAQAKEASRTGMPVMRPLLLDFPEDERCWDVDDQFLFGPDLLVAPVLEQHASERSVYLPAGTEWTDVWTQGARAWRCSGDRHGPVGADPPLPQGRGAARYRSVRIGSQNANIEFPSHVQASVLSGPDYHSAVSVDASAHVNDRVAVGIDVAEARKGIDLVAIDRNRRVVASHGHLDLADLVGLVLESIRPSIVCVDSPSGWSLSGGSRQAEHELARLGISSFATGQDPGDHPFFRWMRVGFSIFGLLAKRYPLFSRASAAGTAAEVFPNASAVLLAGRRRASRGEQTALSQACAPRPRR